MCSTHIFKRLTQYLILQIQRAARLDGSRAHRTANARPAARPAARRTHDGMAARHHDRAAVGATGAHVFEASRDSGNEEYPRGHRLQTPFCAPTKYPRKSAPRDLRFDANLALKSLPWWRHEAA